MNQKRLYPRGQGQAVKKVSVMARRSERGAVSMETAPVPPCAPGVETLGTANAFSLKPNSIFILVSLSDSNIRSRPSRQVVVRQSHQVTRRILEQPLVILRG